MLGNSPHSSGNVIWELAENRATPKSNPWYLSGASFVFVVFSPTKTPSIWVGTPHDEPNPHLLEEEVASRTRGHHCEDSPRLDERFQLAEILPGDSPGLEWKIPQNVGFSWIFHVGCWNIFGIWTVREWILDVGIYVGCWRMDFDAGRCWTSMLNFDKEKVGRCWLHAEGIPFSMGNFHGNDVMSDRWRGYHRKSQEEHLGWMAEHIPLAGRWLGLERIVGCGLVWAKIYQYYIVIIFCYYHCCHHLYIYI